MPEQDSLSGFDFNKISKPGKYLKFVAGRPVTVRVLTKDPVIQEKEFTSKTGEVNMSTKLCFIVWNFTDEVAQIMTVTPKVAQTLQRVANDEDFGANLQKCDIKISPEGEMLERTYDVNVIRHSGNEKQLTMDQVNEAREIDLDKDVQDNRGRLSAWEQAPKTAPKKLADQTDEEGDAAAAKVNEHIDNIGDEPINLDDIPF